MLDSLLVSQSKSLLVDISFEDAELGDQHMINKVTGKALNETMFKTNRGAPRVMDHPVYGRVFYPNNDRFWWSRDFDMVGVPTCTIVLEAIMGPNGLSNGQFLSTGSYYTTGVSTTYSYQQTTPTSKYVMFHFGQYPVNTGNNQRLSDDALDGLFTVKIVIDTTGGRFYIQSKNEKGSVNTIGMYSIDSRSVTTGLYVLGDERWINALDQADPYDIRDLYIKSIKVHKGVV